MALYLDEGEKRGVANPGRVLSECGGFPDSGHLAFAGWKRGLHGKRDLHKEVGTPAISPHTRRHT